jgi:hypothetical protein
MNCFVHDLAHAGGVLDSWIPSPFAPQMGGDLTC